MEHPEMVEGPEFEDPELEKPELEESESAPGSKRSLCLSAYKGKDTFIRLNSHQQSTFYIQSLRN